MREDKLRDVIHIQSEVSKLGLNLPDVLALIVERTLDLVGADGAVIELAEDGYMVYRAVSGSAKPYLGLKLSINGSLSGLSVRTGNTLCCDDAYHDPRVDAAAVRKVGVQSMIVMPLKYEGRVIGVLKAMHTKPFHFDDEDLRVLQLLADVIAYSIHFATRLSSDDLYHQATHDALTSIPNRALFMERLRNIIQRLSHPAHFFVVLLLDLNGFKSINDLFGHQAGDAVIQAFAARLQAFVSPLDTVARLGGDEFALIVSTLALKSEVDSLKMQLFALAEEPVEFEGISLTFGVSIGAAIYPDDAQDFDVLLALADDQMYENKRAKKLNFKNSE